MTETIPLVVHAFDLIVGAAGRSVRTNITCMTEEVARSVRTLNLVVCTGGFFVWTGLIRPHTHETFSIGAAFWTFCGTTTFRIEFAISFCSAYIPLGTGGRVIAAQTTLRIANASLLSVFTSSVIQTSGRQKEPIGVGHANALTGPIRLAEPPSLTLFVKLTGLHAAFIELNANLIVLAKRFVFGTVGWRRG
jgi:hypothetical protein